jgi:glycosyltransferase involved in cell wall biosynthesis
MKQPLRVLHVAEMIRGGVATVLRHLMADQLRTFGAANVRALVPAAQSADLAPHTAPQVHGYRRSGRNVLSLMRLLVAFHQHMRQFKPNVVHIHSTFAGVVVRGYCMFIPRGRRPKIIYCPHAWAFLMRGATWKKRVYAGIEAWLLRVTDAVVCVSRYEVAAARQFGLPVDKLHVIHNGVPPLAKPPHRRARQGPTHALFVGRLDEQKGFDTLHAALQLLPPGAVKLTVIGEAVHGTHTPPPLPHVLYLGWQPPAAVAQAMAQADVLVMPSRWEGFAMVPLEAMSHACAVLATNVCSLPEVVEPGVTGLLVPADAPQALAAALHTTPRASWQAMGQAGYARVKRHFSIATMTSQTTALYYHTLKQA